jgi:hypothetical protein
MKLLSGSVADPSGSGAFLTPGSGIRDPGWVKNQDPGSRSGMNILGIHISESLETILWVKILKFFDAFVDREIFLTLDQGRNRDSG